MAISQATPNLGEAKKGSPHRLRGEHGPDDTLISDFGFQNCEKIHFYCFKLPSLWQFLMTATGNKCNPLTALRGGTFLVPFYSWKTEEQRHESHQPGHTTRKE